MIFPAPRKVFSTKLAAFFFFENFFSLRIIAIKYVSFMCYIFYNNSAFYGY